MASHLSYVIETNGENGVRLVYLPIGYAPSSVHQWENGVNSFASEEPLPDADSQDAPTYVRRWNGDGWNYYRRTVVMPSKSAAFMLSVLVDGSEHNGGFTYDVFSSFMDTAMDGGLVSVTSRTNLDVSDREGTISVTDNTYGELLQVYVLQERTPIGLALATYRFIGLNGEDSGSISTHGSFSYTFHWLTPKTSLDRESLEVTVAVTGPRNGFIVRDVSEYAYEGELDGNCVYSTETGKYYKIRQRCVDGGLETVYDEIVFDPDAQAVYSKVKYGNDLNIVKSGDVVTITSYGRCFLQDDAYYIITLSNVDDLETSCEIIIRYDSEEP